MSGQLHGHQTRLRSNSGVLAASIERSRQKWLHDGVFEKYWTKPSKKKNLHDVSNPAKESMAKLGGCSMIIEPHVFDVTLYSVRETQYTFLPPAGQPPNPTSLHNSPFNPKLPAPPPPTYAAPIRPISDNRNGSAENTLPPVLPPFNEGFAKFDPQGPSQSLPGPSSLLHPHHSPRPASHDTTVSTDPVITMLAARAATDDDLKTLMKIVAQGTASPDQLKAFQRHIDELNMIIQSQKSLPLPNPNPSAHPLDNQSLTQLPPSTPAHPPRPAPNPLSGPHPPKVKTEPLSQYYSQPPPSSLKAKSHAPSRPDISAIVFDFTAGTGDRYLLPKHSIVEYLPGNAQAILSFLLIRTGATAAAAVGGGGRYYRDQVEYYEPVTVRLSAHGLNSRVLEPLGRAVAPAEEVRRYMGDVMGRMERAEEVRLVMRLPRVGEGGGGGTGEKEKEKEKGGDGGEGEERLKGFYGPPDTLLPLRLARKG